LFSKVIAQCCDAQETLDNNEILPKNASHVATHQ